uniref:flagellin n=1 Tax=Proteus terrae TaxID=1574161 RepID=UPI0023EA7831
EQTQFNGVKVLSEDSTLNLQVGANDKEQISVNLKKIDATTLGIDKLDLSVKPGEALHGGAATTISVKNSATPPVTKDIDIDTTSLKASLKSGESLEGVYYALDTNGKEDKTALAIDVKDASGEVKTFKVTLNKSNVIDSNGNFISGGKVALTKDTEIKPKNPPTINDAPLKGLDDALAQVDSLRSAMGAVQNRLDSTITNLGNTVNNLTASRSRILDADYATEVSNMSKNQILQQAGTSVLAQANQMPQNVLSLLR